MQEVSSLLCCENSIVRHEDDGLALGHRFYDELQRIEGRCRHLNRFFVGVRRQKQSFALTSVDLLDPIPQKLEFCGFTGLCMYKVVRKRNAHRGLSSHLHGVCEP